MKISAITTLPSAMLTAFALISLSPKAIGASKEEKIKACQLVRYAMQRKDPRPDVRHCKADYDKLKRFSAEGNGEPIRKAVEDCMRNLEDRAALDREFDLRGKISGDDWVKISRWTVENGEENAPCEAYYGDRPLAGACVIEFKVCAESPPIPEICNNWYPKSKACAKASISKGMINQGCNAKIPPRARSVSVCAGALMPTKQCRGTYKLEASLENDLQCYE